MQPDEVEQPPQCNPWRNDYLLLLQLEVPKFRDGVACKRGAGVLSLRLRPLPISPDPSFPTSRAAWLHRSWVQGDAMAMPFDDACFDAATMGYGLRNVSDIPAALSELERVLRPGAALHPL